MNESTHSIKKTFLTKCIIITFVLIGACSNVISFSFQTRYHPPSGRKKRFLTRNQVSKINAASDTVEAVSISNNIGVQEFNKWWQRTVWKDDSEDDCGKVMIQQFPHDTFHTGTLRGLGVADKRACSGTTIKVPREFCLSAPYDDNDEESDWDAVLALKLIQEIRKGKMSSVYGYCALLCDGTDFLEKLPPSTAPNALVCSICFIIIYIYWGN